MVEGGRMVMGPCHTRRGVVGLIDGGCMVMGPYQTRRGTRP